MNDKMNETSEYVRHSLFALISRGLQSEKTPKAADVRLDELNDIMRIATQHQVQPIVACGLLRSGRLSKEQEDRCRKILYTALIYQERMDRELQRTCQLLETAGIDYMPLKGAVLRKLYPEPWMRTSGDIDILVRDIKRAVKLLEQNGYRNKGTGSHDVTLISPLGIMIEMHFRLIETDDKVNALLERVWEYARPREGTHHYEMEPEMFYFYHVAHMAKHMCFGGCGIRSFTDIWIFNSRIPLEDAKKNYLLRAGGLAVFAEQAERLSFVWLEERQPDVLLLELEQFVMNGGVFGSKSNTVKLRRRKADSSVVYVLLRIFMPYSKMVLKYPVLKKYPVLLPGFWVLRWIELIMRSRKIHNAVRELSLNRKMDDGSIAATKWLFNELELF